MCFLKTIIHKEAQLDSAFKVLQEDKPSFYEDQSQTSIKSDYKLQKKPHLYELCKSLLLTNSAVLMMAQQSINSIIMNVHGLKNQVENVEEAQKKEKKIEEIENVDPFLEKVFGIQNYKFQLSLEEQLPQTLYKERNFNCNVRLIDSSGKPVRNANLIPLCFGVCTLDGEWIHENRQGQPLVKGKSQVDLYQGKAEFQKIYLREVSRPYPDGKLNFVIYAKPSMMKYTNQTALEENVNPDSIMPLLIKDVSIKAKKK